MFKNQKKFDISSIAEFPVYNCALDPFEALMQDSNAPSNKIKKRSDSSFNFRELTDHSNDFKSNEPTKQHSKRGRKSNKQHAEACFDFNAKPISLNHYFSDLEVVTPFSFSTQIDAECNQIETKPIVEDSSSINIQSATEIIVAAKIVEDDIVFDYNLDCLFIEPIEDEVKKYLPSLKVKFESEEKPSKELFVKRRLFSAVKLTQQVDKEWTEEFFKINRSLKLVDQDKLFDDNLDSIHELRKLFRQLAIDKSLIRDFFDFSEDNVNIQKLSKFGFKPGFELLYNQLIAMYVVFNDESFIRKRDSTVHQLNDHFSFLPFDITLRQVFSSIGIGFFNDYFGFTEHIRLIAPFIAGRFKDKVKDNHFIIERKSNNQFKRKKKSESQFLLDPLNHNK